MRKFQNNKQYKETHKSHKQTQTTRTRQLSHKFTFPSTYTRKHRYAESYALQTKSNSRVSLAVTSFILYVYFILFNYV